MPAEKVTESLDLIAQGREGRPLLQASGFVTEQSLFPVAQHRRVLEVLGVARGELRRGGDVGPFGTQVDRGGDAGHFRLAWVTVLQITRRRAPALARITTVETRSIMVNGMSCDHCARAVRAEIGRLPGVAEVDVDVAAGQARITGQSLPGDAALRDAVEEAGYEFAG
jgi:copper chaperone